MSNQIVVECDNLGVMQILSNGVNIGSFDRIGKDESYSIFLRRNDLINGDDLIAIGHKLNSLNKVSEC